MFKGASILSKVKKGLKAVAKKAGLIPSKKQPAVQAAPAPASAPAPAKEDPIKVIARAAKVSRDEAQKMLASAQERCGISAELYAKYAFHDVPESMQAEIFEKIKVAEEQAKALQEKNEKIVAEIASVTGQKIDQVKSAFQTANETLGVTLDEYFDNKFYTMNADAQKEAYEALLAKKKELCQQQAAKLAEARAKVVDTIAQKTGKSAEAVEKELAETQLVSDITPELYQSYRVYEVPKAERAAWCNEVNRIEVQKSARLKRTRQALIARAAMHLGVSEAAAESRLAAISKAYNITFAESVKCHFYSLPEAKKKATAKEIRDARAAATRENAKKYIAELAEDLQCTEAKAEEILTDAKNRLGVSAYIYTLYRFQDVPVAEQAAWYRSVLTQDEDKKESADRAREGRINRVCLRSGWSYTKAEQAMVDAWNKHEISFAEYLQNDFYLLNEEEQVKIHEQLVQDREELQALERSTCIEAIMEYKGCTAEEAEEMLADAERRLKLTPQVYRRYMFFKVPVSEQRVRYQEIKGQLSDRTQIQIDDYESYLNKIINATGWTKEVALENVRRAKKNCGASWKDFYAFKLWEHTDEEQKEFFTTEVSQSVTKKYYDLRSRDIFVNKEYYLEKFRDYLGRNWVVSNNVTEEEFAEAFKNDVKVMYKPSNNGNSGGGIEVFDVSNGCKEAYEQISKLPRGIVEGFLIQHPDLSKLYPHSVNTIRVATICHDGKVEIPYAILRMGAYGSCVDNFTTGGMVADVDIETGKTRTHAVDVHGKVFELHPDTKVPVKGFQIPCWHEGLELVRKAGSQVNGYIGWDLAIGVNGPTLIEGNVDPGNRLLQMPHIPEGKGMAHIMRKYL